MQRRRSGFTLIELLVVIAIIAILAAILFPAFTRAQARGKQMSCTSNLKQLSNAIKLYGADNCDGFPMAYEWTPQPGQPTLVDVLYPKYAPSKRVFGCPADFGNTASKTRPYFEDYHCSYGYPGLTVYRPAADASGYCNYPYVAGLSQSNPVPSNVTDSSKFNQLKIWIWRLPLTKRPLLFDHNPWHFFAGCSIPGNRGSARGFNNLVFCDGHVSIMQYQPYYTLLGFDDNPHPWKPVVP